MAVLAIAGFEFATKLKRISTYVYLVVFTAIAALWVAAAGGAFASDIVVFGSDKVFVNSPMVIAHSVTILGLIGMVTVAAFMGRAVQQDFEYEAHHFFFTSPITKAQYLLGRYLGAVAILMLIFMGIAVGIFLGAYWPGIDATRVGPWRLSALAWPFLVMLLPNVLFLGACFF